MYINYYIPLFLLVIGGHSFFPAESQSAMPGLGGDRDRQQTDQENMWIQS